MVPSIAGVFSDVSSAEKCVGDLRAELSGGLGIIEPAGREISTGHDGHPHERFAAAMLGDRIKDTLTVGMYSMYPGDRFTRRSSDDPWDTEFGLDYSPAAPGEDTGAVTDEQSSVMARTSGDYPGLPDGITAPVEELLSLVPVPLSQRGAAEEAVRMGGAVVVARVSRFEEDAIAERFQHGGATRVFSFD